MELKLLAYHHFFVLRMYMKNSDSPRDVTGILWTFLNGNPTKNCLFVMSTEGTVRYRILCL